MTAASSRIRVTPPVSASAFGLTSGSPAQALTRVVADLAPPTDGGCRINIRRRWRHTTSRSAPRELWRFSSHMRSCIAKVRPPATGRASAFGSGSQPVSGGSPLCDTLDDEEQRRLELSDPRNQEVDSQWQHRPVVRREAQQSAQTHLDEFRGRSIATFATPQSGHFGASCQGSGSIVHRGAGQCSCAHS
jgi:hypothetical protein